MVWKAGKRLTINVDQERLADINSDQVKSRPAIERKHNRGGQGRSRKGRARNDSPYTEERTRSSNKNTKRGDQQRQDQERRGERVRKSHYP
ncbi:hypothetical protein TNCV_5001881 [Trichonephila clavipes]|nr:hypothetical protein TNCV_5001881 [Trichonephila clavipes]